MTNLPPSQRVVPISAPEDYALPSRAEAPGAADAFRQTQFVLGPDLGLFERAMKLQLRLAKETFPFSRNRTHQLTAIAGLWSRSYGYMADALLLTTRGSYASTLPLVRTAAECIAAQEGLRGGEMDQYMQWLATTLEPDEQYKAFEMELGRYFAGSVLASDDALRGVYRASAELGRPSFGATLLQTGSESNMRAIQISFADTSFHQGWAEVILGWLITLATRQVRVIIEAGDIVQTGDEVRAEYVALQKAVDAALARDERCRIEEVAEGNSRRYLVHNFRRMGSGAPRKIIL